MKGAILMQGEIEKHWLDCSLYFVSFSVCNPSCKDGIYKIVKQIVVREGITEEEVIEIVKTKFHNVISIEYVDLFNDDVLFLKE
ncbi:hypothetical protein [Enterococcus rivorum]|nr:hypothetical protein [Enterococcus rivorum]